MTSKSFIKQPHLEKSNFVQPIFFTFCLWCSECQHRKTKAKKTLIHGPSSMEQRQIVDQSHCWTPKHFRAYNRHTSIDLNTLTLKQHNQNRQLDPPEVRRGDVRPSMPTSLFLCFSFQSVVPPFLVPFKHLTEDLIPYIIHHSDNAEHNLAVYTFWVKNCGVF